MKIFSKAVFVAVNYEIKYGLSGPELNNGSVFLFGGDESSLYGFKEGETQDKCGEYRKCKHWYSVGCHLRNTGIWICKNADTLIKIATFLASIF